MKTADAVTQLRDAGYDVEVSYGIVYARTSPTVIADRLYQRRGEVSDRKVKALINKKGINKTC